jgi:hypothetical protein
MSHRLFPSTAIYAFTSMAPPDRFYFIRYNMTQAGFEEINFDDRSPESADPCWIMSGKKVEAQV